MQYARNISDPSSDIVSNESVWWNQAIGAELGTPRTGFEYAGTNDDCKDCHATKHEKNDRPHHEDESSPLACCSSDIERRNHRRASSRITRASALASICSRCLPDITRRSYFGIHPPSANLTFNVSQLCNTSTYSYAVQRCDSQELRTIPQQRAVCIDLKWNANKNRMIGYHRRRTKTTQSTTNTAPVIISGSSGTTHSTSPLAAYPSASIRVTSPQALRSNPGPPLPAITHHQAGSLDRFGSAHSVRTGRDLPSREQSGSLPASLLLAPGHRKYRIAPEQHPSASQLL